MFFKSLFYAIFSIFLHQALTAGVSQCYYCINQGCDNLEIENCVGENNHSCLFLYYNESQEQMRGCVNNDDIELIQLCDYVNHEQDAVCSICNVDLCNTNRAEISETKESVKKCYSCKGTCEKMEVEKCSEDGEHVCLISAVKHGSGLRELRGCFLNSEEIVETCRNIGEIEDGFCRVCREDLCNL